MRDSFLSKFAVILVVMVAFADGFLLANHLNEKEATVLAESGVHIEDVFKLYEEPEAVQESSLDESFQVPFIAQAPSGDWKSPWSDYAEEAVMLMVDHWRSHQALGSTKEVEQSLLALGEYEAQFLGDSLSANMEQVQSILAGYFGIQSELLVQPTEQALKSALEAGAVILVPIDGRTLDNPHYGDPAPEHHMILIYGWEEAGFRAHDPGTRRGEAVLYDHKKILESIQDLEGETRVLIIQPS